MAKPKISVSGRQWIYVFLVFILFLMMLGLNARLSEFFRLTGQKNEMQARIDGLEATREALQTQIAYADSDKAVEEWARTYERDVLPGDIPIIPHPAQEVTPEYNYVDTPQPDEAQKWLIWWELFFE
jgi:cell division protein FtsB